MKWRKSVAGFATGTLFGVGLAVAQMTNPEKVLSFLRLVPGWDPSLALVMVAAIPVTWIGYRWAQRSPPVFDTAFRLPDARQIDARLLTGAALFGVGWGLAGYCPGPVITGLATGSIEPPVFVAAMLGGSQLARILAPAR